MKLAAVARKLSGRKDEQLRERLGELEAGARALDPDRCFTREDAVGHLDAWLEAMDRQADDGAGLVSLVRGVNAGAEQRWNVLLWWAVRQPGFRDFLVAEVDALEPAQGGFEHRTRRERDEARRKLVAEAAEVRVELERRAAEADRDAAAARLAALEGPNEAA
jgi:hypothetical protein